MTWVLCDDIQHFVSANYASRTLGVSQDKVCSIPIRMHCETQGTDPSSMCEIGLGSRWIVNHANMYYKLWHLKVVPKVWGDFP